VRVHVLEGGRHLGVLDLVKVVRSKSLLVVHLEGVHALELLRVYLLVMHLRHLGHLLMSMELLHGNCWLCVHLHVAFRGRHGQRGAKAHAEARCVQVSGVVAVIEGVCAARSRRVVTGQLGCKGVEGMAVDV